MSGLACVVGAKRGWRGGREKSTKEGKGKGASPFPLSPTPLPFSFFPYPLTPLDAWGWLCSIYDVSLAHLKPPLGIFFCKQTTWRPWA